MKEQRTLSQNVNIRPDSTQKKLSAISGFTLLEMLVVLMMVGLISTLLMQSLVFGLNGFERLSVQLANNRSTRVVEFWFRSTVASLAPNEEKEKNTFNGSSNGLYGLAFRTLKNNDLIATPMGWHVGERPGTLHYVDENNRTIPIYSFREPSLSFVYISKSGQRFNQWPPNSFDTYTQLPAAIVLIMGEGKQREEWYQSINSSLYAYKERKIEF